MTFLIKPYHGTTPALAQQLDTFAKKIDGTYFWRMENTTFDDFVSKWKKHFLVYPIESADKELSGDYLIYVTQYASFLAR